MKLEISDDAPMSKIQAITVTRAHPDLQWKAPSGPWTTSILSVLLACFFQKHIICSNMINILGSNMSIPQILSLLTCILISKKH